MLRNVKVLRGYTIHASDGQIGQVEDFFFDDEDWAIRYLVVDTGSWLSSRKVLISPLAIGRPNWEDKLLPVAMTKAQVEHSPDIDTRMPVSRQHEIEYLKYYNQRNYWGGAGLWGMGAFSDGLTTEHAFEEELKDRKDSEGQGDEDIHLRSCGIVLGHHVHATDGDIGHVQDLIIDDETWAIRYMVVDTGNWWSGHEVLVAPQWIKTASWSDAKVDVHLTRQAVKDAPPYHSTAQLDRQQEQGMHKHYGRNGYWAAKENQSLPSWQQNTFHQEKIRAQSGTGSPPA